MNVRLPKANIAPQLNGLQETLTHIAPDRVRMDFGQGGHFVHGIDGIHKYSLYVVEEVINDFLQHPINQAHLR